MRPATTPRSTTRRTCPTRSLRRSRRTGCRRTPASGCLLGATSASRPRCPGAEPLRRAFAKSLLPLVRGEAERLHDAVCSEVQRMVMVRDNRYKYAVDPQGRGYQLHDLQTDPFEQRNLVGHPDLAEVERTLR